jgi:hypothetical protein
MTTQVKSRLFVYSLLAFAIFVLNVPSVPAECLAKDAGIYAARYREGSALVDVALTKRINLVDLSNTGTRYQWKLDDLTALVNIPLARIRAGTQESDGTFTTVLIDLNGPLFMDHLYRLTNPSLTFLGCNTDPDEKPQTLLRMKKNPTPGAPAKLEPPKKNYYARDKSQGRDDSDVYMNGTIEGAEGGKPTFAADVKLEKPIAINKWHITDFKPYFSLKASSTKNGNADSMNFGGKLNINFDTSDSGLVRYVLWTPAGGFESDRRFKNVNLVTSQVLTFGIPGNKSTLKRRIRFLPFIGFELGRNLKSPVNLAQHRLISRGVAGATLYLTFDRTEDSSFSFQVDYIRRFLLSREVSFTEDDDKKLVPVFVGKGPRDYVKATSEYDFSKFTGFTLSYEYGRLPPNFELVNHKYGVGLLFKFQYKKMPGK